MTVEDIYLSCQVCGTFDLAETMTRVELTQEEIETLFPDEEEPPTRAGLFRAMVRKVAREERKILCCSRCKQLFVLPLSEA